VFTHTVSRLILIFTEQTYFDDVVFLFAAMEIIADTIYNSTFSDSDIDIEKTNILRELEVSSTSCIYQLCASALLL